jgi:nickel-dependent lactate racemase
MASDTTNSALFCSIGSETTSLSDEDLRKQINGFLETLGVREDVLILPPDYTRFHSQAGKLTQMICEHYNFVPSTAQAPPPEKKVKVDTPVPKIELLPALGTHAPMTKEQIQKMFGNSLATKEPSPFLVHDWRNDVVTIGHAPKEMVKKATHGLVDEPWPAQLNKIVWSKRDHDKEKQPHKSLVLSIGQVVPHEVMGMANFNKNVFVGTGGVEAINLSHFIGAVHGMY